MATTDTDHWWTSSVDEQGDALARCEGHELDAETAGDVEAAVRALECVNWRAVSTVSAATAVAFTRVLRLALSEGST